MGSAPPAAGNFFPLDEELELLPGSLTPGLEEILVRLGSWMPFAQAQRFLVDWLKLNSLSEATVRRHTEAAGAAYAAIQGEDARALEQGGELPWGLPCSGPARLVVEVDGAMVPLVGGAWGEVKTVVIGAVDEAGEPGTLKEMSYFSRLTDAADFARQALAETSRRGVGEGGDVALVSDGAEWIQGFGDFHCPGSERILDFPHAAGYVAEIGRGLFREDRSLADEWQREQIHRLKEEGAGPVLPDLRVLVQRRENDELRNCLAYLEKREAQMQYPAFQAQGWPIGSGAVESANKLVVEARLKGGGMHWARSSVNPMLGLRNIVCNGRWAEEWPRIARRLRAEVCRGGRAGPRPPGTPGQKSGAPEGNGESGAKFNPAERPPGRVAQPEAPVKSPGGAAFPGRREASKPPRRPAANHPWRQAPVGRAI